MDVEANCRRQTIGQFGHGGGVVAVLEGGDQATSFTAIRVGGAPPTETAGTRFGFGMAEEMPALGAETATVGQGRRCSRPATVPRSIQGRAAMTGHHEHRRPRGTSCRTRSRHGPSRHGPCRRGPCRRCRFAHDPRQPRGCGRDGWRAERAARGGRRGNDPGVSRSSRSTGLRRWARSRCRRAPGPANTPE